MTQVSGSQCVKILHLLNIDYCGWFHGYSVWIRRRRWHPTPVLLLGKSHGQRSLVGCGLWGLEESDTTEWLHFHFSFSCIGEGNGNPLQCSCLENPRDRGAWWAAVYGVAQSRTWLKWLSSSSSKSYQVSILWYYWRDKHINDSKWRTHEKGPYWFTWFLTNVQKQFSGGGTAGWRHTEQSDIHWQKANLDLHLTAYLKKQKTNLKMPPWLKYKM